MDTVYFILITWSVYLATGTQALQCWDCGYYKATSGSSLANLVLNQINALSDTACQLKDDDDRDQVDIRNCPDPATGNVAKCADIEGTIDTTVLTFSIKIETITRNCIEVTADDREYSDGCHNDLPSTAQNLVKNFLSGVGLGDMQFTGEACYSRSDLSAAVLSSTVSYALVLVMACLAYLKMGLL